MNSKTSCCWAYELTLLPLHTGGASGFLNIKPNAAKLLRIEETLRESTCGTLTCMKVIETSYSGEGTNGEPAVMAFKFHLAPSSERRFEGPRCNQFGGPTKE